MPEWTNCPSCQLRHTRRPDGLCPRCKTALDGSAAAAPQAAPAAEPPPVAASAAAAALPGLGKLAQSARSEKLKNARGTMWAVGILTVLANGVFFALAGGQVDDAIEKELRGVPNRALIDQAKVKQLRDQAVRQAHLINAGGMLLGFAFVGCALSVQGHPVPATVTALALYLGGNAVFGMLNPQSLTSGAILKIIVTVALFKAVQAAIAYQKEQADAGA